MALTYEQSAALINDMQFRGRIKVACLNYASRMVSEPGGFSNARSNALLRWSMQALQQPDQVAQQVQGPTVMEPGVQESGASIDDGGLQFATENAVNKIL